MIVYGDLRSGNTLKVKWTADYLNVPYTIEGVDTFSDATRSPSYREKFPMGQAPGVDLGQGRYLAQSNAIMRYLARGTTLLPEDPFLAAKVDEILFWEQYSHEPYIAVCYTAVKHRGVAKADREAWRVTRGENALDFMEQQLQTRGWIAADRFTIADIALFAYTRNAEAGGFSLTERRHVTGWIDRVASELRPFSPDHLT